MTFIARCRVKEITKNVLISEDEYNDIRRQRENDAFLNALLIAKNQILGVTYKEKRSVFADEFKLGMQRILTGLYSVPIMCNGIKMNFVIDTGAQVSGIFEQSAKMLNKDLLKKRLEVSSIGGKNEKLNGIIVDRLIFGSIEYQDFPMVVMQDNFLTKYSLFKNVVGFDGLIGWDILSKMDFEIDDIACCFKMIKNKYRFDYGNLLVGSFPVLLAKNAEGEILQFGFDSGSRNSWLAKSLIENHALEKRDKKYYGWGVHGFEKMESICLEKFEFNLAKAHVIIRNIDSGRVDMFGKDLLDGVLGNEIFRNRRIRFINSKNIVLFK